MKYSKANDIGDKVISETKFCIGHPKDTWRDFMGIFTILKKYKFIHQDF